MTLPVFIGGLRTPFGIANRGFWKDTRPDDLLVELFKKNAAVFPHLWETSNAESGLFRHSIDDVIIGCAYPEGEQGYNVARNVALGLQLEASGFTVNRLCGSSLEAAAIAASFVHAGRGVNYLIGGTESMSRIPRRGAHFSPSAQISETCPTAYITMGETAEKICGRFPEISRAQQEDFAALSHEKTHKSYSWYHPQMSEDRADESVRFPVDRVKMAALKPAFNAEGIVTAATSSPMSDGAVSGWVMSEERAKHLGCRDGLRILDVASAHVEPEYMGLGPIPAVRKLFQTHNLQSHDLAAIEMNEAFAVQVLACQKILEIPADRLNSWGGALAIGHPLGASGLRLLLYLYGRLQMYGQDEALGLACLCIGGGQGLAVLVQYKTY